MPKLQRSFIPNPFLTQLVSNSNMSGNTYLLILAATSMYRMTLKHGLCPTSTSAFTTLAVVRCVTKKFIAGKRLCNQAISLQAMDHAFSIYIEVFARRIYCRIGSRRYGKRNVEYCNVYISTLLIRRQT